MASRVQSPTIPVPIQGRTSVQSSAPLKAQSKKVDMAAVQKLFEDSLAIQDGADLPDRYYERLDQVTRGLDGTDERINHLYNKIFQPHSIASSQPIAKTKSASKPEQPVHGLAVRIESANKAVEVFKREPNATNAQKMLDHKKWIVDDRFGNPKVGDLIDEIDVLIATFSAVKIPQSVEQEFGAEIDPLAEEVRHLEDELLHLDFSKCSLEDFLSLERREKQLIQRLEKLKTITIENLHTTHKVDLHPNLLADSPHGLTYTRSARKGPELEKVHTSLSTMYGSVADPLSRFHASRCNRMREFLTAKFTVEDMGGGGDCLFRSLAGAMSPEGGRAKIDADANHSQIRRQVVSHIREHREKFAPLIAERIKEDHLAFSGSVDPFESYLEWMSKLGTWGGKPEIMAFSDMETRSVAVIQKQPSGEVVVRSINPEFRRSPPVAILNSGAVHFQAMKSLSV